MVFKDMIKLFDERKRKLNLLLDDNNIELKNERVHQIRGAIGEIELFLMTMRQHQSERVCKNFTNTPVLQKKQGLFSTVGKLFKAKEQPTTSGFTLSDSYKVMQR